MDIFLYKKQLLKVHACYDGVLTLDPGEIFKNMLQLKRFCIYFKGILNRKWLLSYRNNDISYRDAMGLGDMFPENFSND